jgi:hypothetical protein
MARQSLAARDFRYIADPADATKFGADKKYDFSPVKSDDLAYALSVFVAAANSRLRTAPRCSKLQRTSILECERLFLTVSNEPRTRSMDQRAAASLHGESTLPVAFAALWNEYLDDASRDSICARVLGFYYLMERTAGRAIRRWVEFCPDQPEAVSLDLIVVQALASVPLSPDGHLSQALLLEMIGMLEKEPN